VSGSNAFASLDLNLLRVYRALIREGNVTRAAQSLNRTQSAVSSSLARLRESLGDVLFETTPKGIRPTDRGSELWTELEPYLSGLEQVLAPAVFDPSRFDGVFRICMSDFGVLQIMPRLFQQLQTAAPHVQIDVKPVSEVDQLRGQLERGELDMVMGTFYDETGDMRGASSKPATSTWCTRE
jgi:DNA-binding transcriptional LysR family regulator